MGEEKKKECPLAWSNPDFAIFDCEKEKCAWYDSETQECAIYGLHRSLLALCKQGMDIKVARVQ